MVDESVYEITIESKSYVVHVYPREDGRYSAYLNSELVAMFPVEPDENEIRSLVEGIHAL